MKHTSSWRYLRCLFTALVVLLGARPGFAHPMGNFSINHYSGIHVERTSVEIRYIIDIAEIPTYQEVQNAGIVAQAGDPSLPPYLVRQAEEWGRHLELEIDGRPIRLLPVSRTVIFPPGAGGLPTMKIGIVYRGALPAGSTGRALHLHYSDGNYEGHAGWKEIVVTSGHDVTVDASQPFKIDRSAQLTNYPTNLLNSPPQDLEASFTYSITAPLPSLPAATAPGVPVTPDARKQPNPIARVEPQPARVAPEAAPAMVLAPNRQATAA